ncbi:N-acetylneuraminate synthase [Caldicellulosiruptor changbaiensis]|uniref:N-acetylneuraminate synthase n=1 Tax=Caldicellulosiruptor changbaiensis TaxID=1222016 RepID=A0A3T0D682_9FIRM|nr:N-acetylneuraminate synthase [Caldicellulosiruptor changbaiensis]AZT90577.1 N-acetylneuraminate synthase [Caldicellulosiruptor changbaiensis]
MNSVFIIAEAGVNHNGSMEIAKRLIDAAKEAGANAIKFQTYKTENLVTKYAEKANYQKVNTGIGTQFEMLKRYELTYKQFEELKKYCDNIGIEFLSTPFDCESAKFLNELGVRLFKVSSGDLTYLPFLEYIAKFKKPIILSTGMSNLGEIEAAINIINQAGCNDITLLHCTSSYPAKVEDVNLKAIITLKEAFKLPVGYSDHTEGIEVAIAAIAIGATIIEKHLTLDKKLEGPDHKASLSPNEFKFMVDCIRNVEKAMGNGIKKCTKSEEEIKVKARRSIVAKRKLLRGEEITFEDIEFKRPAIGLQPNEVYKIIGKKVKEDIEEDEIIKIEKISW